MTVAIAAAAVAELAATFSGTLLTPADAQYDTARRVHNGMIDRRPALIARCLGTADVVDAIGFARARGLAVSVRGGGHNVAGNAVADGAVMIDLSFMKGIHVDPTARTVRAQGGAIWREFNRETQRHGLATTGGVVSTTGIAGLTLGGGLGWLMGKHGLAADNLIGAEVVTASGEIVRASERENADLLWGLRGGGGNFGAVSWLEYRLHPVGPVTSGLVAHPFARARAVLEYFRELTAKLPDELTLAAGLLHAPDGSGVKVSPIVGCHVGAPGVAEAAVRPIKAFGSPLLDTLGPSTYELTNSTIFDPGFPRGALSYWKASFLTDLTDAAIDVLLARFETCPSPMTGMVLEHFHGAVTRVGQTETAFPHRREGYNLLIASQWAEPGDSARNIEWTRGTFDAMRPHFAAAQYVNYLAAEEGVEGVRAAYGPNYARLGTLKAQYDPTNLFRFNQNIRPSA